MASLNSPPAARKVRSTASTSSTVTGQRTSRCPPAGTLTSCVLSPSTVTPSASSETVTFSAPPVLLLTTAPICTTSLTVKKRGVMGRRSSGRVVTMSTLDWPTSVSTVTALALSRQVVSVSGRGISTVAMPSAPVVILARQKAVSGNSRRTSSPSSSSPSRSAPASRAISPPPPPPPMPPMSSGTSIGSPSPLTNRPAPIMLR